MIEFHGVMNLKPDFDFIFWWFSQDNSCKRILNFERYQLFLNS